MKIAVNTRLLLKNKLEGIGWFTYESFIRIVKQHPEHEFYFIFDRKYDDSFVFAQNVTPIVIGPPARHPLLFYIWYEFSIPRVLKKINADLFISPDAFGSLRAKGRKLTVIHDLNFEHFPKIMPTLYQKYYKHFTPKFAKSADRIATVSEFSKSDIVKQYGVSDDKIDVVYNGANKEFKPLDESTKRVVKDRYSKSCDYFVFIGALNPRKNLTNLFKAFDIFKTENESNIKLLIVGEKMYWSGEIKETYEEMTYKDDVIFTGRLEPENLHSVVGAAIALSYVSIFEGFGIPIVEAWYAETPVITSNVTSMPEIAGDAAIITDPFKPESIAEGLKSITFDKNLRSELIERGRKRRSEFSWQKTADKLWASIEKTLNQTPK
ncbi:MAG: glycosyltransferase family 1 protein [Marinilabiliales bacterium]|nr:MAG: glycosyltransferase family 1 protein [Marinilabiliales bacterium]